MEQIIGCKITTMQGPDYLSGVIKAEMANIARLKMLSRVDSTNSEDDIRPDDVTAEAWARVAERGINHTPNLSASELVRDNIERIRKDFVSEPVRH